MTYRFLHLALAGLIGGGVVGATLVLSTASPAPIEPANVPTAAAPATDDALLARVAALEERNLALEMQLSLLRESPAASERETASTAERAEVTRAEFEELAKRIDALRDEAAADIGAPEALRRQIAGALTEIRKEETTQKIRGYHASRRARIDADLATLGERLQLNARQSTDLRTALLAQYDREDEQMRLWEGGAADEVVGARKQSDAQQLNEDLQRILSEEQIQQF